MKYVFERSSDANDIHTEFHKDRLRRPKVDKGDTQTAWRSHKPTFIFIRGKLPKEEVNVEGSKIVADP
jgi:hypothetical protein